MPLQNDISSQDGQVFKEKYEDSPGILIFCQGDWWHPTPDKVRLLKDSNYYVMTAANGRIDLPFWLPEERCIGGMFGHQKNVEEARLLYPDKVIERFEGVGSRFLKNIMQDMPYTLWYAGISHCQAVPKSLKSLDVVSSFSPVPLKRGNLLIEALVKSGVSAYIFAHTFGANQDSVDDLLCLLDKLEMKVNYFHFPFDPYALISIDNRIILDIRPLGANNSIVAGYLSRTRLFIHTSTTEGFSNAVMEALNNDVPVLICDDIEGPLQTLSKELPQCFTRVSPDIPSLVKGIQEMLQEQPETGSVRKAFKMLLDPFEINQKIVLGAQAWFALNGIPWKGHCLGIFGGNQSKLNLANISAEESYRGSQPIYPNLRDAASYTNFQLKISKNIGNENNIRVLSAEKKLIDLLIEPSLQYATESKTTFNENSSHLKVSVYISCIPAHNKYLPNVLRKYLAGTRIPDEIVIGLSEWKEGAIDLNNSIFKDPRIRLIGISGKADAGSNRQLSKNECNGDIILYQDADDLPHSERVEIVEKIFLHNEILTLAHSYLPLNGESHDVNIDFENLKQISGESLYNYYFPNNMLSDCLNVSNCYGDISNKLNFEFPVAAGFICIRKEVLNVVRWKSRNELSNPPEWNNPSFKGAEDYEFFMECLFYLRKSMIIDAPLYFYRT